MDVQLLIWSRRLGQNVKAYTQWRWDTSHYFKKENLNYYKPAFREERRNPCRRRLHTTLAWGCTVRDKKKSVSDILLHRIQVFLFYKIHNHGRIGFFSTVFFIYRNVYFCFCFVFFYRCEFTFKTEVISTAHPLRIPMPRAVTLCSL